MFIPPGQTINAVKFKRDKYTCAAIGQIRGNCTVLVSKDRYRYYCSSEFIYTLTIPAQNMTEYEQGSAWYCEYFSNPMYRSPMVILNIASKITNSFKHRFFIHSEFSQPYFLRISSMFIELLTKPNHD